MFIDIHAHVYRYPYLLPDGRQAFPSLEQLIQRHNELGIDRAVLLPLVSPEIYIPQTNEEIIEMADQSNGRFIAFCNIDPRAISNSGDAPLGYLLRHYLDLGCKGIGEVLPNLAWRDPRMQNLLRHVEEVGLPLIFDITGARDCDYGIYDDPGLPQLEECLQRFPNLTFLGHGPAFWAEIAPLESPEARYGYPRGPVDREGVVPRLFREYPNLHGDLSAGSGANAMMRDPAYGARFLNEFQDRMIYGTDICGPTDPSRIRDFLISLRDTGQLREATFEKIARGNAIRLLGLDD